MAAPDVYSRRVAFFVAAVDRARFKAASIYSRIN
jgi:hypothetical protein